MHGEDGQLDPADAIRHNDAEDTALFVVEFKAGKTELKRNTPASTNLAEHVERLIQIYRVGCRAKSHVAGRQIELRNRFSGRKIGSQIWSGGLPGVSHSRDR